MNDAATVPSTSATFCPARRRRFVLIAAILASSMGFIDGSVISIAVPAIRADLGATLGDAQWVSNAYLLLLSSVLLIGGAAGDRFGVRTVFALGIGLFVAASAVCALVPNAGFLILARAAQGLGAAFMVPSSLAIIAKAYPKAERGKAIGIWAAASSLTMILGPILGGLLLTWLGDWSWRLVFAINLPLGGLALALLLFLVPADEPASGRRLDLLGGLLATVALLALAWGLTGDGSSVPPPISHIALYCTIGLVLLGGFLFWETRAREPMMPLRLFASRSFSGANGLTLALYFSLSATLFYLPMTMIAGWGATAAEVSVALAPLGIALTLLSTWAGRLADRFGPGPPIAGGSLIVAAGFAGMALLVHTQSIWFGIVPMMIVMGVGMGFVVSPLSTAVMTSVDDDDTGTASGVNNAVARVAGLLAVAVGGGVVAVVFEQALGGAAELPVFFGLAPDEPLDPATEAVRVAATNTAFSAVAWLTAALSIASAAIAWLTLERRLGPEA